MPAKLKCAEVDLVDSAQDLDQLLAQAREVRAQRPGPITFSPKVFIPLTKLCRDVCHYCTFAQPPRPGQRAYMSAEEILAVARAGAAAGCSEALFTLGDRPELRYRVAREELAKLGFDSTLEYLRHAAELVLDETGLLPHLNPGVMNRDELAMLRPVSASMGIMLESVSERLHERGGAHFGSPDKQPVVRIATIAAAGELEIPFTTGILIGIGETRAERIDALQVIRELHERYGHIQEVIVQNFRAKPGTLMAQAPEPSLEDLLWTVATARLILPVEITVQTPPNLSDKRFPELLDAGINDWGGVSPITPDHVNPEAPWPELEQLEQATESRGLHLAPRLPIYPEFLANQKRWLDPQVYSQALALSDSDGLARGEAWRAGEDIPLPPVERVAQVLTLHAQLASMKSLTCDRTRSPVRSILATATSDKELTEEQIETLLKARGSDVELICEAADQLRQEVNGDEITFVVNRNINYTNVCYFRCGFCAFSKGQLAGDMREKPYLVPLEEIERRVAEAWERGATEVCLQGGIHPSFDGEHYIAIIQAAKRAAPDIHVHAFTPLEVWQGAATLGLELEEYLRELKAAGLGSLPGTSAEILDDEIRRIICPDKNTTEQWVEVMLTAHRLGLPATTTVMFGHIEQPRHWARHLVVLREAQKQGGGFTEFVPLPFVHMEAPMARRGQSRHGPSFREVLLMHAVGRLALHPWITNIQTSWVKLGPEGTKRVLQSGANDLGGTLMNESISRAAGASFGQELSPEAMEALIESLGRTPRQRSTLYDEVSQERVAAGRAAAPLQPPLNPPAREAKRPRRSSLIRPGLDDRSLANTA